ncbi:MAG: PorV/PorQ family protein [Candidatus Zixiibacteriota bacterium]|nr:MAG: PorV/PorQ family protein [candidate division Zixibacteria bacterium]
MMRAALVTAAVIVLLAGSPAAAGDAGQESPFTVGLGARALGMGGGFTSLADDASAIYYNPAGLALLESQEVSAMHMRLFEGTSYNFGGWVYPDIKLGGFGLGYMRIGTDDIVRRTDFVEGGTFDYAQSQFLIAYGQRLQGGFSLGLSFKLVNQSIDNLSDYAFGFDLGMMARMSRYFTAGLMFRDMVPPELELQRQSETTPISVAGGMSARLLPLSDEVSVTGVFELEKIENRSAKVHGGVELLFNGNYALRGGYDKDNLSFGAGLKLNRLKIDYAYKVMDYVDDSHRFSVSFLIGTPISAQRERSEQLAEQRGTVLLEDERRRQFEFFKEKADGFYSRFHLDSALVYYQRALAFDEDNEAIVGTIAAIERSLSVQLEEQQRIRQTRLELQKSIENYYAQAQNFFAKKYYPAALDMLELIFDINPNYIDAVELKRGIEKAIGLEIEAEFDKAVESERGKNSVAALESYHRILELDPDNQRATAAWERIAASLDVAQQLDRGISQYNAGDYENARITFGTVLLSDRENPVAIEYLRKIDAVEERTTTLEDLYRDREIWQLYLDGLRHMRNREYQKAIDAWNRVLEVYPNNVNTLNNIEQARLRLQSEDTE